MSEEIIRMFERVLPHPFHSYRSHRIAVEVRKYDDAAGGWGPWLDVGRVFVVIERDGRYRKREVSLPREIMDELSSACDTAARRYYVAMRQ